MDQSITKTNQLQQKLTVLRPLAYYRFVFIQLQKESNQKKQKIIQTITNLTNMLSQRPWLYYNIEQELQNQQYVPLQWQQLIQAQTDVICEQDEQSQNQSNIIEQKIILDPLNHEQQQNRCIQETGPLYSPLNTFYEKQIKRSIEKLQKQLQKVTNSIEQYRYFQDKITVPLLKKLEEYLFLKCNIPYTEEIANECVNQFNQNFQ